MITATFQQGKHYRQTFYQNDETPFEVTLRDTNGNPRDLTALDVTLAAKISLFDETAEFELDGTLVDAEAGIVEFAVTSTETGNIRDYIAEIQVTDGASYTETLIVFQLDILRGIA